MGESDTAIMWTIVIIFLILGFVTPFIHSAFAEVSPNIDTQGFATGLATAVTTDGVNIVELVVSMVAIFFFSFGLIPLWLDLTVLLSMRFMLVYLIFRGVRGI